MEKPARRTYKKPAVKDLGSLVDLTRGGFSMGNDEGGGKSGNVS